MQAERGFTLIELLIVIAVLGVLSVGVLTAVNVTSQINKANLAKVETFDASIQNSLSIDLVGEWKLDQETTIPGPPVKVKDTSGYGNDGTVTGATLTTDRKGQANKAYLFNGTTDHIQINDPSSGLLDFGSSSFSFSFWLKSATNDIGSVISKRISNGTLQQGWMVYKGTTGRFNIYFDDGTGGLLFQTANSTVPDNSWTNFAVVVDRNTNLLSLYKNGAFNQSGSISTIGSISNDRKLQIGSGDNDNIYLTGSIDDVRIYSQALTVSNIQQLYAQGFLKHYLAYDK